MGGQNIGPFPREFQFMANGYLPDITGIGRPHGLTLGLVALAIIAQFWFGLRARNRDIAFGMVPEPMGVLIARLLAQWPHLRVKAALLVAPAETAAGGRIGQFGAIPEQAFDVPATVVASRNDPWMGFGRAAALARAWDAELVDLGFAGHINVASGFGPWAEGKLLRDALRDPVPAHLPLGALSAAGRNLPRIGRML